MSEMETAVEANHQNVPEPRATNIARKIFLRRVFMITVGMLVGCLLISSIPMLSGGIQNISLNISALAFFLFSNVLWLGVFVLSNFILSCLPEHGNIFRKWIILFTFTVISGLFAVVYITYFDPMEIIGAFMLTLCASILLTLFGTFATIDVTTFEKFAFSVSAGSNSGVVSIFFVLFLDELFHSGRNLSFAQKVDKALQFNAVSQIYSVFCALLRMFIFIIFVQQTNGKMSIKSNENQQHFYAMTFFADILQIFMFILGGIGDGDYVVLHAFGFRELEH